MTLLHLVLAFTALYILRTLSTGGALCLHQDHGSYCLNLSYKAINTSSTIANARELQSLGEYLWEGDTGRENREGGWAGRP